MDIESVFKDTKFVYIPGKDLRYTNNLRAHLMEAHGFSRVNIYRIDPDITHETLHWSDDENLFLPVRGHHHYVKDKDSKWSQETISESTWV